MRYVYYADDYDDSYLSHHGILGMKWGIRRFQNKDGSLTSEGKKHREENDSKDNIMEQPKTKKKRDMSKIQKGMASTKQLMDDYPSYAPKGKSPWNLDYDDPNYDKSVASSEKLYNKIIDTSYDWYNSEPKSERMKKVYKPIKDRDDAFDKKYEEVVEKYPLKYLNEDYLKKQARLGIPFASKEAKRMLDENKEIYRQRSKEMGEFDDQYRKDHPELYWQKGESFRDRDYGEEKYSVQDLVGEEKMLGMVLNDLGYEDTKQGRDYIRDVVMWD